MPDKPRMVAESEAHMRNLKIGIRSMRQNVETLSGGQRQGVAVARSAFARRLVILDEPTAALGAREAGEDLNLVRQVRDRGVPVILIRHHMPNVIDITH